MASAQHKRWTDTKKKAKAKAKLLDKPPKRGNTRGKSGQGLVKKTKQEPIVKELERTFNQGLGGKLDLVDKHKNNPHERMAPSAAAASAARAYIKTIETYEKTKDLHEDIADIYLVQLREIDKIMGMQRQKTQVEIRKLESKPKAPPSRLKRSMSVGAPRKGYESVLTEQELVAPKKTDPIVLFDHPNLVPLVHKESAAALGLRKLKFKVAIEDKTTLLLLWKMDSSLLAANIWQKAVSMDKIKRQINTQLKSLVRQKKSHTEAKKAMGAFLGTLGDQILLDAYEEISRTKKLPSKITKYRLKKTGQVLMTAAPATVMVLTGWTTGVAAVVSIAGATTKLLRMLKQELRGTKALLNIVEKELKTLKTHLNSDQKWKNFSVDVVSEIINGALFNSQIVPTIDNAMSKLDSAVQNNTKLEQRLHKLSTELNKMLETQLTLQKALTSQEAKKTNARQKKKAVELVKKLAKEVTTAIERIQSGNLNLTSLTEEEASLREQLVNLNDKKDLGKVGTAMKMIATMAGTSAIQGPFVSLGDSVTNLNTSALALTQAGADLKTFSSQVAKGVFKG